MTVKLQMIDNKKDTKRAQDMESSAPRLLSLRDAADYLGVSYWTIRDWISDGVVARVRLPGSRLRNGKGKLVSPSTSHSMRKFLLDRRDLDKLIEEHKEI